MWYRSSDNSMREIVSRNLWFQTNTAGRSITSSGDFHEMKSHDVMWCGVIKHYIVTTEVDYQSSPKVLMCSLY